jgi:small subunit ribosomal protein S21
VRTLPKVEIRSNESPEQLLRRFNKTVIKSKVLGDIRRKRWFISKSELNRIEKKKAIRRLRKVHRQSE